jgi:hypothetical protein
LVHEKVPLFKASGKAYSDIENYIYPSKVGVAQLDSAGTDFSFICSNANYSALPNGAVSECGNRVISATAIYR